MVFLPECFEEKRVTTFSVQKCDKQGLETVQRFCEAGEQL
jgi:hypothetical protein